MANAQIVSPAAATTYCVPSSSYVIGPLLTPDPRFACHSGAPVVAFSATRLFDPSPANTRFPAVLISPDRPPPDSHLWLQRILPVLYSIACTIPPSDAPPRSVPP